MVVQFVDEELASNYPMENREEVFVDLQAEVVAVHLIRLIDATSAEIVAIMLEIVENKEEADVVHVPVAEVPEAVAVIIVLVQLVHIHEAVLVPEVPGAVAEAVVTHAMVIIIPSHRKDHPDDQTVMAFHRNVRCQKVVHHHEQEMVANDDARFPEKKNLIQRRVSSTLKFTFAFYVRFCFKIHAQCIVK